MRSLVVLIDGAAPSFCYYDSPPGPGRLMDEAVLGELARYARHEQIPLQLVCGESGLPAQARRALEGLRFICYAPAGAQESPGDVPVVDASAADRIERIPAGRHTIAVLRVAPEHLGQLPETWRRLAERVYRVVLVLVGLDRADQDLLQRYRQALTAVAGHLERDWCDGRRLELNALSDRLALQCPQECGAGIDHLTIDPQGQFHLCPGFAADGAVPIGDLSHGHSIPDADLLTRERAPVCKVCDAYQCRRCLYLNHRATLELNTPSWQSCRAAHIEREVSRLLLDRLHDRGALKHLPAIASIDYDDPIALVLAGAHRGPGAASTPAAPAAEPSPGAGSVSPMAQPEAATRKEPAMAPKCIGRVTAAERDEIRELHLRKHGLSELFASLARLDESSLRTSPLYDKVVRDMAEASLGYQAWWDAKAQRYGWERGRQWRVDFETCEVFVETAGSQ